MNRAPSPGVFHELRTSLNIITGLAELLLGEKPGRLNREQRACLGDILASGRGMLHIIETAEGTCVGKEDTGSR